MWASHLDLCYLNKSSLSCGGKAEGTFFNSIKGNKVI